MTAALSRESAGARVGSTAVIAAVLIGLSPLTLAMYGPSMPAMVAAFDTTRGQVQLSLTVYLVAFALAQLAYGPLSDRFGRRPTVFAGLSIYLAGCIVGGFATSIEQMLAARVLEGIGACGGSASSRAFVRDRFDGPIAARVFSLTGLALALAPALGPAVAGYLQRDHGWQAIFLVLGVLAALLLLVLWFAMPETLARGDRRDIRPGKTLRGYLAIFRHRGFLRAALLMALAGAGTYYYVALAPFVLIQQLNLDVEQFGLLMPLVMLGYFVASGLAAAFVGRIGPGALLALGTLSGLAAALALFLLLLFDSASVPTVLAALICWMVGIAFLTPVATTAALTSFQASAGTAAATLGFLQMLGSGLGALAAAISGEALRGLAPLLLLLLGGLLYRLLAPGRAAET